MKYVLDTRTNCKRTIALTFQLQFYFDSNNNILTFTKYSIEKLNSPKGPTVKRLLHLICKILNIFRVFFENFIQREQYLQYKTVITIIKIDTSHLSTDYTSYKQYLMVSLTPRTNSPALHTLKYITRDIKIIGITISNFAGV